MAESARSRCRTEEINLSRSRDKYCPHCECVVPNTTFYRHKLQFYDEDNGVWSTVPLRRSTATNSVRNDLLELQSHSETFMETDESTISDDMEQVIESQPESAPAEGLLKCSYCNGSP